MYRYCKSIIEGLKNDKRLRLWICFPTPDKFDKQYFKEIQKEIQYNIINIKYRIAKYLKWDLIIYPDHGPWFRKDCKKIYISHDIWNGLYHPNKGSYRFNPKRLETYNKIFVTSKYLQKQAAKLFPEFMSITKQVGNLLAVQLLSYTSKSDELLKKLHFNQNQKTIMVISTWRDKSFAQNVGIEFMDLLPKLLKKYNIIFSIHQNNFLPEYSPSIDWNKIMKNFKYDNFYFVRQHDDTYKFLPISDMLITDHTTLGLYYPLLSKPIIYYYNKEVKFYKDSLGEEFMNYCYIIENLNMLCRNIENAFNVFNAESMNEFKNKVFGEVKKSLYLYKKEIYNTLNLPMN